MSYVNVDSKEFVKDGNLAHSISKCGSQETNRGGFVYASNTNKSDKMGGLGPSPSTHVQKGV